MVFTVILTLWQPFILPVIGSGTCTSTWFLSLVASSFSIITSLSMRSASSNSERVIFYKPGSARTLPENSGTCAASILKPYPISCQRVCDFPFRFKPVPKLKNKTKQTNKQPTTTRTYLFPDHDSRNSRTLFYLSFNCQKLNPIWDKRG